MCCLSMSLTKDRSSSLACQIIIVKALKQELGHVNFGDQGRTRLGTLASVSSCWTRAHHLFSVRFLAESVYDLQNNLKSKGSNLLVRFGKPEKVVPEIIKALQKEGHEVSLYSQAEVRAGGIDVTCG